MPIIKCRECGKNVSTATTTCPHCGVNYSWQSLKDSWNKLTAPLTEEEKKRDKRR